MASTKIGQLFSIEGLVAVVTGGSSGELSIDIRAFHRANFPLLLV